MISIDQAFLGQFRHTLDNKGRLTLPAKLRGPLSTGLVLTRGSDHCLLIFTIESWQALVERVRQYPLMGDPRARRLRYHLFANADGLVPDAQGRVLISPAARAWAGITNEVVIVGQDTHLEVWDSQAWDAQQADQMTLEDWALLGV